VHAAFFAAQSDLHAAQTAGVHWSGVPLQLELQASQKDSQLVLDCQQSSLHAVL
jgi:hypothetical protein